jgi:hypothetical protein
LNVDLFLSFCVFSALSAFSAVNVLGAQTMNGIVNPFEPWRPVEAEIPPPVHASQPWRPTPPTQRADSEEIPFAELADPPERCKQPKRKCAARRAERNRNPSATTIAPKNSRVLVPMVFLLGLLVVLGLSWLGGDHFWRITVTLAAVGVGFIVAFSLPSERGWHVRLGWLTAGLTVAALSAWFVPTLHGVSLWSAYAQVEELRTLPVGDMDEYRRGEPARRMLVEAFPSFASDVSAAELAWVRRTVDEAVENADRQLEVDPYAALSDLHRVNAEMARLDQYVSVRNELQAAEQRATQACVKVARR